MQVTVLGNLDYVAWSKQKQRTGSKMIVGKVHTAVNRTLHTVGGHIAVYAKRVFKVIECRLFLQAGDKEVITYAERYARRYHLSDFRWRDKRL